MSMPFINQQLIFDPQTSGGLLVAVAPEQSESLSNALHNANVDQAAIIGQVAEKYDENYLSFN